MELNTAVARNALARAWCIRGPEFLLNGTQQKTAAGGDQQPRRSSPGLVKKSREQT